MAYLVANNAFTPQGSSCPSPQNNPSPNGSYGYRAFGQKCVMAANIDRVLLSCGDGENGTGTNSTWEYDIDARQFKRIRPDPLDRLGHGAVQASADGFHDYLGPATGDNRFLAYHPPTGKVWLWGGNVEGAGGGGAIDIGWQNHIYPGAGSGVYIYDPTTWTWTKPETLGYALRYLAGAGGWDPNIQKFLQIMGEQQNGLEITNPRLYEIDPSTGPGGTMTAVTWDPALGQGPYGRVNIPHQFVYHARARKWILFGGNTNSPWTTQYNDTWLYDAPTRKWTNLNPTGTPTGRGFAMMWYDSLNNVVLLTGGSTGDPTTGPSANSTWAYSLEYNTWTDLGITFSRKTGGCVFDATRNLAILTPGTGLGDTDVYTFRYAIPRAAMVTRQWYAMPQGTPGLFFYPEKHLSWCHCPLTRRVYHHGGDTNQAVNMFGVNRGASEGSYYQRDFSLDLLAHFATPSNRNAGAREEFTMCVTGAQVRPKHPDFVGWAWDSKRKLFWHVPGESFYVAWADMNCDIETEDGADNGGYKNKTHLLTFDPANPSAGFVDVGTNHGVKTTNDFPWRSWYDPLRDEIVRFEQANNGLNPWFSRYNITTGVWTHAFLSCTSMYMSTYLYWTVDPQRRRVYFADRANQTSGGNLTAFDLDTAVFTNLGPLPGVRKWVGSGQNDKGYLVFDWHARLLVYMEMIEDGNHSIRVWTYDVDNPTAGPNGNGWTDITLLAAVTLDGSAFNPSHLTPEGDGGCFDPDNNMVVIGGSYNSSPYLWALRLVDMGVAAEGAQYPKAVQDTLGVAENLAGQFSQKPTTKPIAEVDLTQQPGLHGQIRRG